MSASPFQRNVQFVTVSYPELYYCGHLNCFIDDLFEIGHCPLVDQTSLSLLDVFCLFVWDFSQTNNIQEVLE